MRHTHHNPAGVLTAVVVTLAVALGGCGGAATEIGDLPADAVFLSAVDASTDISTVRVSYESTIRRDGELLNTSTGEAVFAPDAVSLTFTMGGFRGEGDGSGDLSGDLTYELRFVGGTMYMRIPDSPTGMAPDDLPDAEWVVYDDADTDGMAAQMEQLDFAATLQALRDSAEVTEEGHETIAGVATTRYVGTTTLRSLLLAQGMTEEQLEDELAEQQELGGTSPDLDEPMPLTVWVGDDGLVRRFDYTTANGQFETTQSMTVLEYGLEVDIVAPPAEETMSAEEFESSYQSSSGSSFYSEDFESSEGTITLESEGSATAEAVPAPSSRPSTTGDSDG